MRSTAGKIFGAIGGVMEAAIRRAYFLLTGKELKELKVQEMRGLDGIKEAKIKIGDLEVGVAVASSWSWRTLADAQAQAELRQRRKTAGPRMLEHHLACRHRVVAGIGATLAGCWLCRRSCWACATGAHAKDHR